MNYKKLTDTDIIVIKKIFGENQVLIKEQIEEDYHHDELQTVYGEPDLLVFGSTKEEIMKLMKYCYQESIAVTVRGSGTGLVGGCVPLEGGIILDMHKMNHFIELDKENMTLTLEPGVLLMEISEYVEKEGLFYAPDPGEKSATIGGNISTNAGGMRAVKYGVTRDWVRGLEVVLPNGELIKLGGKVVKNSSGYSLKDLMIGSEGTLGIIVEATLKLIPKPKFAVSLLIPFQNRIDAINAVPKVLQFETLPTAVEFLENKTLKFSEEYLGKKIPNADFSAYLLVSFDGTTQVEIDHYVDKVSDLCVNKLGAIDVFLIDTDERKTSVWSARGAFLEAIKASTTEIDECDVVLPRTYISAFLTFTQELSQRLNVRIPYFGHAGDGNLHIYFCKDQLSNATWNQVIQEGFECLYQKAFEFGGLVSGEHGIGYAKKSYLAEQVGTTQMELMKGIKNTFDPKGILNPRKIV
ncbi:MAG: FAD-binding oxidoreductase [Candidatus Izemoplasmatales bacterium]